MGFVEDIKGVMKRLRVPDRFPEDDEMREVVEVFEFYSAKFPDKKVGIYDKFDWLRIRDAYRLVDGARVLDIGVGNGAFLNILSRSGRFDQICGTDIRRHSMLQLPEGVDYRLLNVVDMGEFADGSFDSVVCMEVLEHLELDAFPRALSEVRRVTGQRLILTLPYNEPEPVWWHDRPGGHRQSFGPEKLESLFDNAVATILKRKGTPWMLIVEDQRRRFEGLKVVEYDDMRDLLDL